MSTNQIKLAGALMLTALLAACSSAENNFAQPGFGLGATNECNLERCVTAEFTLAPTEGLGYRCGIYTSVTDQTGTLSCLPGDRVQIFVGDPDGTRQIFFGDTLIDAFEQNSSGNIFNGTIRRITPLDLTSSSEVTSLESSAGTAAINIIRLLDALNVTEVTDDSGNFDSFTPNEYVEGIPINQISIPLRLREAMSELIEGNLSTEDFVTNAFIDKTEAWLSEFGLAITLTREQAAERLNQALNVSVAGLYYGLPGNPVGSGVLSTGISGSTGTGPGALVVAMEIYGLQNRSSKVIGQGMYWNSSYIRAGSSSPSATNLPGRARFDRMSIDEDALVDPLSKNLTNYDWSLDDPREQSPTRVSFYQGKLIDNRVIFGNQSIYELYAGTGLLDQSLLGRWSQFNGDAQTGGGGDLSNATIFTLPTQIASSFLQPSIWITRTAVDTGEKYIFPLSVTASMSYLTSNGSLVPVGKVGLLIREDGNIWSDGGGIVNPDFGNLGEPNCTIDGLDKPVGYIRSTLDQIPGVAGSSNGSFINPSFLLNGDEFGPGLDGAQVGAGLDGTRLTLNINSLVRATSDNSGSGSVLARGILVNGNASSFIDPIWVNTYNANLSFYATTQESQGNSVESDLEGIEDRRGGTFSMALSACDGGGSKVK
jgi:hypothetical protein